MSFPAFWLPALEAPETFARAFGVGGGPQVELRIPSLTPELVARQLEGLRLAHHSLAERPVRTIVRSVDRVARRLREPGDPLRQQAGALLPVVTGLSQPMVDAILDRMAADWLSGPLEAMLTREVGELAVLDGFGGADATGRRSRARGPRLAFHVFSGNVPGVAVTSLIRTLLTKTPSFGKAASGETVLAPLFARALAEIDPLLGESLAVAYWPGGEDSLESIPLAQADAVIAYGSASTIRALRERTPRETRFLGYGSRLSVAVIARETLAAERRPAVTADAALAVALFDQQGCVSPQTIFVEQGGDVGPEEWARELAARLAALEESLPRGTVTPEEASAILQLRGQAEFAKLAGGHIEAHCSSGTAWTVIYDADARVEGPCLYRTVRIVPVPSIAAVAEEIAPMGELLQTVGIAADAGRLGGLAVTLADLGVTRITSLARMPWPPGDWRHDGRPVLGDLLQWCDWE